MLTAHNEHVVNGQVDHTYSHETRTSCTATQLCDCVVLHTTHCSFELMYSHVCKCIVHCTLHFTDLDVLTGASNPTQ